MGNHGEPGNSFTYGIPDLMELDDCFVDLADHPKLVAVVQHVAGAGGLADGDDELFVGHVLFELEESNVIVQEQFHLNLFRLVHFGRFKRLESIDFIHHLLNIFV